MSDRIETPLRYTSLSAFIAHYHALKSARDLTRELTVDQSDILAEMDRIVAALDSALRETIDHDREDATPAAARRIERARRALAHELTARGILTG